MAAEHSLDALSASPMTYPDLSTYSDLATLEQNLPLLELPPSGTATTGPAPQENPQNRPEIPRHITVRLYVSHFLSTWNSRSFEFGAVLFLASIFSGTLLHLSIYALLRSASAIIFSSPIGHAVDTTNRLSAVRFSIVGGRVAVIFSCVAFWILSTYTEIGGLAKVVIFSILVLLSCIEKPCSIMNLVAIERDWVVEIAQHDEQILQGLNSEMRRIDLVCKLVGPLTIAFIDGVSTKIAIIVTVAMNIGSIPIEYLMIEQVYRKVPELRLPKDQIAIDAIQSDLPTQRTRTWKVVLKTLLAPLADMKHYCQHPAFLPSLSLCLLYFNVLTMSGQQITYLVSTGYTSFAIGMIRALSTAFEISATWLAPQVMGMIGAARAGMWFLSWQIAWLGGGVCLFWVETRPDVAVWGLITGTIMSRIGLWGYDLSAQTIVQQEVVGSHRGSFSATETSVQNLFELLSYATTIIWASPDQFRYPAVLNTVAVYTAAGLYAFYLRRRRGHLVHFSACTK